MQRSSLRCGLLFLGCPLTRSHLPGPVSSPGSSGPRRFCELARGRAGGPRRPARRRGALAQRLAGGGLLKGQISCAAAHPAGHRLAPQRLNVALGCAAGGERIPEMSPTPIAIQTQSIVVGECRCWKPFHTRCTASLCKGHVPGRKGNK